MTTLTLRVAGDPAPLTVRPARLVVAGYTGRDAGAVRAHIDELAAAGVPPPVAVPMFYELDPALLTTAPVVPVAGARTSGEVEPVYLRVAGRWYLGVGSDHTDRDLEREDIARAKAACPKPLGPDLLPLPDPPAGPDPDWDATTVSARADGEAYQDGTLAALRTPGDLLARLAAFTGDDGGDLVVYGGTVPLRTGSFHFGSRWELRLATPTGAVLAHEYAVVARDGRDDPGA